MQSWAILAQNLVEEAARPFEPRDKPADQIHRAYKRLRAHQLKAGHSKVRRAYYGQAGEATYRALADQAETVGMVKANSPWLANTRPRAQGKCLMRNRCDEAGDDGDYISRLRAMRRNAFGADAEVLDWILSRLGP